MMDNTYYFLVTPNTANNHGVVTAIAATIARNATADGVGLLSLEYVAYIRLGLNIANAETTIPKTNIKVVKFGVRSRTEKYSLSHAGKKNE
ncbi:hypothetical protein Sps_03392 [Shewanella psychrophila]|uniref:Uncharacterized protein n=1 Tax=Shewanella psychrophila TaxID=225848 RepID=A0A1S6HSP4_9GAMM|nr:hypothetical protein [Shewanella psychrophila]AQS38522.1 hypothetical protein Sps_03392 [Shewanella psychrophila]